MSAKLLSTIILSQLLSGCIMLIPLAESNSSPTEQELTKVAEGGDTREVTDSYVEVCNYAGKNPFAKEYLLSDRDKVVKYVKLLKDPDAAIRTRAASSLGDMGSKAQNSTKFLVEALNDKDKWVRRASAKSLGKIGATNALPALQQAAQDRDWFVAHSAKNAMGRLKSPRQSIS